MKHQTLQVLLVEDDEDDFILTTDLLGEMEELRTEVEWASGFDEALELLKRKSYDLHLVDYNLGKHNGVELFHQAKAQGCSGAFILLTGNNDRSLDLEAMKAGATDYLIKGKVDAVQLERSIRYSLERCRAEQELARLARYDHLTGLPNRLLFQDRLNQALALAFREHRHVALLFLDLDNFKAVNDQLGHQVGDMLLRGIASRLEALVRESDTLARLGGDEMVIVLPDVPGVSSAAVFAGKILESLQDPFVFNDHQIQAAASIGIAIYPHDSSDPDQLLEHADAAMYRAKQSGGRQFCYYSDEMNAQVRHRLDLESNLRQAWKLEEFALCCHPLVKLASGDVVGHEAFLCWQNPERGHLFMEDFAFALDGAHLANQLGLWMLRQACAQARNRSEGGMSVGSIAVKLLPALVRPELPRQILGILQETRWSAEFLQLEFDETTALSQLGERAEIFEELQAMGLTLVLGDFGTGRYAMEDLIQAPFQRVKISSSFISKLGRIERYQGLIRGMIELAHHLGKIVVAEGVVDSFQADFLSANGCDEAVGSYFHKDLGQCGTVVKS